MSTMIALYQSKKRTSSTSFAFAYVAFIYTVCRGLLFVRCLARIIVTLAPTIITFQSSLRLDC